LKPKKQPGEQYDTQSYNKATRVAFVISHQKVRKPKPTYRRGQMWLRKFQEVPSTKAEPTTWHCRPPATPVLTQSANGPSTGTTAPQFRRLRAIRIPSPTYLPMG